MVLRFLLRVALAGLIFAVTGCHRQSVDVRVSPDADRYERRTPISPEQFRAPCEELIFAVDAPVGYAMARRRPLRGYAVHARLRWNSALRPLLDHFDSLSAQHNRAEVTVQEFDEREAELLAVAQELKAQKLQLDADLDEYESAKEALTQAPEEPTADLSQARARMQEAGARIEQVIRRAGRRIGRLDAHPAGSGSGG